MVKGTVVVIGKRKDKTKQALLEFSNRHFFLVCFWVSSPFCFSILYSPLSLSLSYPFFLTLPSLCLTAWVPVHPDCNEVVIGGDPASQVRMSAPPPPGLRVGVVPLHDY